MKNKKKIIISVVSLFLILGIVLAGIYFSKNFNLDNTRILKSDMTGLPNPSGAYCSSLGYKSQIITGLDGGQHSICIFPDGNQCTTWDFYRGKCGQEWSYCSLKNYDLKNLSEVEGWGQDGSVCIDKETKTELGNVYNLINEEWANQNK